MIDTLKIKFQEEALGANAINKLSIEELEENQRIAIEALEAIINMQVRGGSTVRNTTEAYLIMKDIAEQALSTTRGK